MWVARQNALASCAMSTSACTHKSVVAPSHGVHTKGALAGQPTEMYVPDCRSPVAVDGHATNDGYGQSTNEHRAHIMHIIKSVQ